MHKPAQSYPVVLNDQAELEFAADPPGKIREWMGIYAPPDGWKHLESDDELWKELIAQDKSLWEGIKKMHDDPECPYSIIRKVAPSV